MVDLQYNPNTVWVLSGVYSQRISSGFPINVRARGVSEESDTRNLALQRPNVRRSGGFIAPIIVIDMYLLIIVIDMYLLL